MFDIILTRKQLIDSVQKGKFGLQHDNNAIL